MHFYLPLVLCKADLPVLPGAAGELTIRTCHVTSVQCTREGTHTSSIHGLKAWRPTEKDDNVSGRGYV